MFNIASFDQLGYNLILQLAAQIKGGRCGNFAGSTFRHTVYEEGCPPPPVPPFVPPIIPPALLNSVLSQILITMAAQIVAKDVAPVEAVGLTIYSQPSLLPVGGDIGIKIRPGRQTYLPQTYGIGRYAGAPIKGIVEVICYERLALDRAYTDVYYSAALEQLVWSVVDALQLYLPNLGNGLLTMEPIRILGSDQPVKYLKSTECGYVILPFEAKYNEKTNPSVVA